MQISTTKKLALKKTPEAEKHQIVCTSTSVEGALVRGAWNLQFAGHHETVLSVFPSTEQSEKIQAGG